MRLTVVTLQPFHWSIKADSRQEAAMARDNFINEGLSCSKIAEVGDEYAFIAKACGEPACHDLAVH